MAGVDEIENSNTRLAIVLPMQPSGILLSRSLPRDGHRKQQRIQWRMSDRTLITLDVIASGRKEKRTSRLLIVTY